MPLSLRQFVAPALFAALLPLVATAQAGQHGEGQKGPDRERMQQKMEEHRQAIYERAEISDDKQQALNDAHRLFREEMTSIREDHHERMANILTDDEQEALRNAMREARKDYQGKHANAHHGKDKASQ